MADLENEIKNAPTPEQIKESSPVAVKTEPVKEEAVKEAPAEEKFVSAPAEPKASAPAAAAAPVVDKAAADRIAAEQKAIKKAEKEQAKKQAEEYGHGFEREAAFLCVHSMLHLLGYDHETSKEDDVDMRRRQSEILSRMGLGVEK